MVDQHDQLLETLRELFSGGLPVSIPPKIFDELGLRLTKYDAGKVLVVSAPASEKFCNPMGSYQGGVLGAVFDAAFGTMAFLIAERPCTTAQMEMQFMRPLPADGRTFTVEVRLRALRNSMLFLEGRALDRDKRQVAAASTTMLVLKQRGSTV
jgi:uncharacterized protein (TIGR00369 family)